MKARGLTPSNAAYTSAIRGLIRHGHTREAWRLFEKARGTPSLPPPLLPPSFPPSFFLPILLYTVI